MSIFNEAASELTTTPNPDPNPEPRGVQPLETRQIVQTSAIQAMVNADD